jgi:hypothetical protein
MKALFLALLMHMLQTPAAPGLQQWCMARSGGGAPRQRWRLCCPTRCCARQRCWSDY